MANDHPPDCKSQRLSIGDSVVIIEPRAVDKYTIAQIDGIYGGSVGYHHTHAPHIHAARHCASFLKIPEDVGKDPKLIDAFLVLSGLKAPND